MREGKWLRTLTMLPQRFCLSLCWRQHASPCLPFCGEVWGGLGANCWVSFVRQSKCMNCGWCVRVRSCVQQLFFNASVSTCYFCWDGGMEKFGSWCPSRPAEVFHVVSDQLLLVSCSTCRCLDGLTWAILALNTSVICHWLPCLFLSSKANFEKIIMKETLLFVFPQI